MELTARQNEIIEESIKIIDHEGIQKLTTRLLAKKIGITEAALYRHFKSKKDILLTLLSLFKEKADDVAKSLEQKSELGVDELQKIFLMRAKILSEKPYYAQIIFSTGIFNHEKELKEKVKEIIETHKKSFKRILKKAKERGQIKKELSCDLLAQSIIGTFRFIVTQWKIEGYSGNLKEKIKEMLNFYKNHVF